MPCGDRRAHGRRIGECAWSDDRRCLLEDGFEDFDESQELGIGSGREISCHFNQGEKFRIGIEVRAWLHVHGILIVAVLVEDLRFEAVGLFGHAVAQGAESGGG